MKQPLTILTMACLALTAQARHVVFDEHVKTLQVVVNQDWLSPPVMTLGSDDVLNVSFDELSHDYHRYVYQLEHCEADWTPSQGLFESDWLEGFNGAPIEDYENSVNTTVLYTHYRLQLPNTQCRLKMSGNYRLHVYDDNDGGREVLCAEFRVKEDLMGVGLEVTTNTDLGLNTCYQQVGMSVSYNQLSVTNPDEQIKTVVMQNGREDNCKKDVQPNYVTPKGLQWEHNRALIFEGGNEYHKYEVLDVSHPTMGIDQMVWDGANFHAHPYVDEPRHHYVYDQDADGGSYIRNSDNRENDYTCDYVYVHYKLCPAAYYEQADVMVDGNWTTEAPASYVMSYDPQEHSYTATILQKQGYYSYQYLMRDADGTTHRVPEEGSFAQTENRYQVLVYYKGTGERTWRLVGYRQAELR